MDNPRIWLPLVKRYKKGKKTTLIIIPGASHMPKNQLSEILEWQEEKIDKENPPEAVMPSEDVKGLLKEFSSYLRRKAKDGTKRFY
jgi:hypothetical protein